MKRRFLYSVVFLLALLSVSCSSGGSDDYSDGDTETESGDINALIASGKDHLTRAEHSAASDDFEAALEIEPENAEASFGRCLAYFQELNAYIDNVLRMLESQSSEDTTATDGDADAESTEDLQAKLIAEYFVISDLRESGLKQLERLNKLKDVSADFEFSLERYPLTLNSKEVMDLHSEWDRADVYALSGLTYFLMGLADIAISQQADEALARISIIGKAVKDGDDFYTALARLLDEFDFLVALDIYRGAELWREAFDFAAAGADDFLEANRLMSDESDEQDDDILIQNSSLTERKVRHFAIQGDFPMKPEVRRVPLLWDGEELSVKDSLERLSTHLKGDAELRLRFEEDVLTIVGVLLDFVRKAFGIEELLGMFGLELDQKTLDLINGIGSENGEEFPQMLISLLPLFGIPGDLLQLDLYTFASRPMGLRDMLPNRGIDPVSGDPVLLMSFECARIGYARKDFTAGEDALVIVSDPAPTANVNAGAGNDSINIIVKFGSIDAEDDFVVIDEETLAAGEHAETEALFQATVSNTIGDNPVEGDGVLTVLDGGEIRAYYTDASAAEDPITVMAKIRDGEARRIFSYNLECSEGSERDYTHFASTQFASAVIYPDPPAELLATAPYPLAAVDGEKQSMAYGAFASPSFNGLIWLKMSSLAGKDCVDYGFEADYSPADSRGINLLMHKLALALSDLLGL